MEEIDPLWKVINKVKTTKWLRTKTYNALKRNHVHTLDDVNSLDLYSFSSTFGVGKGVTNVVVEMRKVIRDDNLEA